MRATSLTADRVDAYLDRLGAPTVQHDLDGLAQLQAAHLRAVPFHNLLLLANDGRPYDLQALDAVVDEAIAGVGGNCDRTTPPFTALLQSLGFDARLIAASVRARGDHFACLVRLGDRRLLCDVGNGHPYLRPWDLDGPIQTQAFTDWRFVFDPHAAGGPTLSRQMPDGRSKTVYVVDPTPRAYRDFAPMVKAHYGQAEFGPFLTGLRSVNIGTDAILTLRDAEYARHTRLGRMVRTVHGRASIRTLLTTRFKLAEPLVDEALQVLARRRPDLLGPEPKWMALGRGTITQSAAVAPPPRAAVPDVLISVATVGRPDALHRLLRSIATDRDASGYPGRVGVLVVDNHADAAASRTDPTLAGLPIHRVPIHALRAGLARSAQAGVVPPLEQVPAPIGVAREAQLHALHAHLQSPLAGLPHPSAHPTVVWMMDDDLALEQLGDDGRVERRTHALFRVARLWSTCPQHSVVLGTFTGDPPVPGLDCLGGQLRDLTASAHRMRALGADARWSPPARPPKVFDAYYDLTESAAPPADAVWPYAPQRAGEAVRAVARGLLADLPRLLDGQQLTRRLTWDGTDAAPRPSLRRGGNTLFLDLDALFRWPTPALRSADGVTTRRADSLWAALAQRDDPSAVIEATLPVLHLREAQQAAVTPEACAAKSAAQVRGVVMARALAQGAPVAITLADREARVTAHRATLRVRLRALREALESLAAWADPEIDAALPDALGVIDALDRQAANGAPRPGDARALETFVRGLQAAVQTWREMWCSCS